MIENREVGGEGENCEKDSEVGGNKTEESDTEESDHFEDCPNFPGKKWPILTANTLRLPGFTNYTHPDHRSQERLLEGQNRSG